MKVAHFLLATIASVVVISFTMPIYVSAEQGYARIDLETSKSKLEIGEEFKISIYITGLHGTEFGKAGFVSDDWYPRNPGLPGYEFVRFEPGSDFPISVREGIRAGMYDYQCRYFERQATADMSGRHLFGAFVYRAASPGVYSFSTRQMCATRIESLGTRWGGILWENTFVDFTIGNPPPYSYTTPDALSLPPPPQPPQSPARGATVPPKRSTPNDELAHTTSEGTSTGVLSAQGTTDSKPEKEEEQAASRDKTRVNTNQSGIDWLLITLLPLALLPAIAWSLWTVRKHRTSR